MRTIGMLGGMSWESTAEYYRLANELVRERLGGVHSARILLDSVDFAEIEGLQSSSRWDEAGTLLATRAQGLEAAGADIMVLCTNTMHKVAGAIEDGIGIPLLHIADATAAAIRSAGLGRVGLLGTAFTMEQPFYRDRMASRGIEVLVPEASGRDVIHRVIYDELVRGIIRDASRAAYHGVIADLVAQGAEGIVLGCTEIELLLTDSDSPVPVFPTAQIHVQAAVEYALDS